MGFCLRSRPEPGWTIGEAWSRCLKDLDLWLVFDGRGRMTCDGATINLRPGVAVLARPGGAYTAEQDPRHRLCVDALHFDLTDTDGRRVPEEALPPQVLDIPDVAAAEAISRRVRDRYYGRASDGSWRDDGPARALLRGLLLDLENATRPQRGGDGGLAMHHRALVTRAQARLNEAPADPPTVAELAAEAGYSPDHFGRVFREVTGRSPQSAAIRARLGRARYLLRFTPMTVSQIADALNYSDLYFFSRQFKRFTGESPTTYRRRSR